MTAGESRSRVRQSMHPPLWKGRCLHVQLPVPSPPLPAGTQRACPRICSSVRCSRLACGAGRGEATIGSSATLRRARLLQLRPLKVCFVSLLGRLLFDLGCSRNVYGTASMVFYWVRPANLATTVFVRGRSKKLKKAGTRRIPERSPVSPPRSCLSWNNRKT